MHAQIKSSEDKFFPPSYELHGKQKILFAGLVQLMEEYIENLRVNKQYTSERLVNGHTVVSRKPSSFGLGTHGSSASVVPVDSDGAPDEVTEVTAL